MGVDFYGLMFPFSFASLAIGVLLGGLLMFIVFGAVACLAFFILIWWDILRIDPILDGVEGVIRWLMPSWKERIQEKIRSLYPIKWMGEKSVAQKIYLWHPHGVFSTAMFFHGCTPFTGGELRDIEKKGGSGSGLSTVVIYWLERLPFGRQLMKQFGCITSREKDMRDSLQRGESLSVALGGVREILMTRANEMCLRIAERKGVFRLALEHGCSLVPVLVYGENEVYELSRGPILDAIYSMTVPWQFVIPVPTWKSITRWFSKDTPRVETVVGECIPVEKMDVDEISERHIKQLRNRYIQALKDLYTKTRHAEYKKEIRIV